MTSNGNAFTDPDTITGLYQDQQRLAARTTALHRAKIQGRPVADVLADLALAHVAVPHTAIAPDIAFGRGTSSWVLLERLQPRRLLAVDASAAMLAASRDRIGPVQSSGTSATVGYVQADFHWMPLSDASCDLAVAALCLHHTLNPRSVIAEIARILAPGGTAILVTKSVDSYRALDRLVATSGLDPDAVRRPSLYQSAHSGNLETITTPDLHVLSVEHEEHRFVFSGIDHVAADLATTPKYKLPPALATNPSTIAAALRAQFLDGPIATSSVITYLTATRGDRP